MSDFKEIIDYLQIIQNIKGSDNLTAVIVDTNYNKIELENEEPGKPITEEELLKTDYSPLSDGLEVEDLSFVNALYLFETGEEIIYYIKKEFIESGIPITKYRRIPIFFSDQWEVLNVQLINELQKVIIGSTTNYYYNHQNHKIIFVSPLKEIVVTNPVKQYKPNNINASDGEEFVFNYLDHEGYTEDFGDKFLRSLDIIETYSKPKENTKRRTVTLRKSKNIGRMHLIPNLTNKSLFNGHNLKYNYVEDGIPFNSYMAEWAIKLNFNYFGSLLEFINRTVFNHLDDLSLFDNGQYSLFFDDYMDYVEKLLKHHRGNQILEVLYYVPIFVFKKIDLNFLWNILDEVLDQPVTNVGLNKEDITIKILEGIALGYEEKYNNKNIFLAELINRKTKNKEQFIKRLFYRIDGENYKNLLNFLWDIWKKSTYAELAPEKNHLINFTDKNPLLLDYRSKKSLGLHVDNAVINWDKIDEIDVTLTVGTGVFETNTEDNGQGGVTIETTEIKETHEYSYHPFAPIIIINADNPTFIYKDPEQEENNFTKLPAFLLHTHTEKAFWENVMTTGEYTVDVITTLSGVLNILKFGRLFKVLQAGKKLTNSSRVFTKVVTGVKSAAGVAEISSGSVNFLLKLTGGNDTDLGREISKYLFYFEMIALSGELSLALYSKFQASARKILAKEEVLKEAAKKTAKNSDELSQVNKQVDEVIEQLRKVANDITKQTPEQMWKEYKYADLFPPPTPPKKPCFLAGTLVKTQSGLVAIETIKEGAKVLTYNFDTKKNEYQAVLQTFSNYAEKYLEIHTENEVLKVTGAHLFYLPKENKWIAASQLKLDMQLIDAHQNLVAIKKLDIIKKDVSTYNLEVAQNHNYYVGEEEILTHNDSKKLKFTNTELFDFEFYEYLDYNNKPLYVGQTTQGLTKRADQHLAEYNKTPAKKEFMKNSPDPKQIRLPFNPKGGPYKMTPFEAAITEMYELNTRGGKRINDKGLFNKKNPVSKRTFDKIKKDFPNFNPCRFYV